MSTTSRFTRENHECPLGLVVQRLTRISIRYEKITGSIPVVGNNFLFAFCVPRQRATEWICMAAGRMADTSPQEMELT